MCLGVPGQIIEIREGDGFPMAVVDFGGATQECCLAYVPEAAVGDYAIVHVGFAIALVDEESALATLALLDEMGPLDEQLGAVVDGVIDR